MKKLLFLVCAALAILGCSDEGGEFPCLGCEDSSSYDLYGSCRFYSYGGCEDNVSQSYCNSNGGSFEQNGVCPSVTYTLTVNSTPEIGGSVSTDSYTYGTVVTVTAAPYEGYRFVRWSGDSYSSNPSIQVTMNGNRTLTAEFALLTYTLTTNASSGGSINRTPSSSPSLYNGSYTHGTIVEVTAVPYTGYRFVRWSGASTSTSQTIQVTMNEAKTLSAEFEILSYTLTTSASSGGTVSRNLSSSSYTHGTSVTVTATPNTGYKFVRWQGASSSTSTSINITMDENKTLYAEFELLTYTLTTSTTGSGTISRSPSSSSYAHGTNVTVTATPSTGYAFVGWLGASTSTNSSITITMDGNKTLTAQFLPTYTLSTSVYAGSGTITKNPSSSSYVTGTSVTVTATPSTGYRFVKWSGASTSTSETISVTMNENKTLQAEFAILTYTLTTNASTGGTVSRSPNNSSYNYNTLVTVTATPNSNYRFVRWSGASSSTSTSVTLTMTEDKDITAIFEYAVTRGTLTDSRDAGKSYNTVQIGTQNWMAENLNYEAPGSRCYDDDDDYCEDYGRLYDWATAMGFDESLNCNSTTCSDQIEDPHQGICPDGWHIPSDTDWSTLNTSVGGSSTAARYLKSQSGWNSCGPVGSGSTYVCEDIFGFSALPGGIGYSDGSFGSVGDYGYWWSASESGANYAYRRDVYYDYEYAFWYDISKSHLFSVRCVQD